MPFIGEKSLAPDLLRFKQYGFVYKRLGNSDPIKMSILLENWPVQIHDTVGIKSRGMIGTLCEKSSKSIKPIKNEIWGTFSLPPFSSGKQPKKDNF